MTFTDDEIALCRTLYDHQLAGARIDTGQGGDVDLMGHQYDRFTQGQFVEPATQFAGLRVPPGEIVKKRVEDRPLFDWTGEPPAASTISGTLSVTSRRTLAICGAPPPLALPHDGVHANSTTRDSDVRHDRPRRRPDS